MAVRALGTLYGRFVGRTDSLVLRFASPLPPDRPFKETCSEIHRHGKRELVIRLQVAWGEFCRELVSRSALGSRSVSGMLLTRPPGVSGEADVRAAAKAESGGIHAPWHKPKFATRVAKRLGVQNLTSIQSGLSAFSAVDNVLAVRNYIVHPSKGTKLAFAKVAHKFAPPGVEPDQLLGTLQPGGATLFETWVADLQTMAKNAVR